MKEIANEFSLLEFDYKNGKDEDYKRLAKFLCNFLISYVSEGKELVFRDKKRFPVNSSPSLNANSVLSWLLFGSNSNFFCDETTRLYLNGMLSMKFTAKQALKLHDMCKIIISLFFGKFLCNESIASGLVSTLKPPIRA